MARALWFSPKKYNIFVINIQNQKPTETYDIFCRQDLLYFKNKENTIRMHKIINENLKQFLVKNKKKSCWSVFLISKFI